MDDNIDILFTNHAQKRFKSREIEKHLIQKNQIKKIIDKVKKILISSWKKYEEFVIHSTKLKLNIVGTLVRKNNKWVFRIITLMIKDMFYPRSNDKFIEVYENCKKNIIFVLGKNKINEMKNLKSFKEFIDNKTETSNYEVPKNVIEPQKNDKIIGFVEDDFEKHPNWGHDFEDQEKDNQNIRK